MAKRTQLNVYLPKKEKKLLEKLKRLSAREGKPVNAIVIEALREYIERHEAPAARLRTFKLGLKAPVNREDLYDERLKHKA